MNQALFLDQAIDPMARIFQGSSNKYNIYLQQTYGRNAHERVNAWSDHFKEMHTRTLRFFLGFLEDRNLRRSQLHTVLMGPGFQPTVTDFGYTLNESLLREMRAITILDYSTQVVAAAMHDVRQNIRNNSGKLFGMQYDVTSGFSTAYSSLLAKSFGACRDFTDLQGVAKIFAELSIDDLQKKLSEELALLSCALLTKPEQVDQAPVDIIGGGVNINRSLHLSIQGEYQNPDVFYMPMLIAGTGAAAEREYIWSRFEDLCDSDPSITILDKQQFYTNIHELIANYNTIVATLTFRKVLADNPHSRIFAVSDKSTIMYGAEEIVYPRLHLEKLTELLKTALIKFSINGKAWHWHDEPSHCHEVSAYEARLLN